MGLTPPSRLNNVKKNCTFLTRWLPLLVMLILIVDVDVDLDLDLDFDFDVNISFLLRETFHYFAKFHTR